MTGIRGDRAAGPGGQWLRLGLVWLAAASMLAGCGRLGFVSGSDESAGAGHGPLPPAPVEVSGEPVSAEALRERVKSANVIVCVIDAARADHVGCYGYPRETTPNIDRLAGESVVFSKHFAPFPLTKPSTVSLFTSQYPDTHLIAWHSDWMDPDAFSMANALESAGFESVFLSSSSMASPWMGIGKDFEFVCGREDKRTRNIGPEQKRMPNAGGAGWDGASKWHTPDELLGALSNWLDTGRDGRFFMYVHFMPPHIPYEAPAEMQKLFKGKKPPGAWQGDYAFPAVAERRETKSPPLKEWVNLYDANLRWADWAVGGLEEVLREKGVLDETLLVVTSDHGESFGEHGYKYHVEGVYDEQLHVPMLVRFPGSERITGRLGALTETVDVLPTLLDLFGVPWPAESVQGRSLVPLLSGDVERVRDYVYATCGGDIPSYLVRDQEWALMLWAGGELRALYDLRADPRQTRNVLAQNEDRADRMADAFRAFAVGQKRPPLGFVDPAAEQADRPAAPRTDLTDEERRELEALGYME